MDKFSTIIINLLTAETGDQIAALALAAWAELIHPDAGCLLLWDEDLGRHTVGETWINAPEREQRAPAIRRQALHVAQQARQQAIQQVTCLESGLVYQPLYATFHYVGAYVCFGVDRLPDGDDYEFLVKSTARALYTILRLQEDQDIHRQLQAERERLEQLLLAVEQQQRTIDRLLALERQFSASLEAKVEERTAALRTAQDRLIQTEKLAVIGQLASSLAHELNNPLQGIRSGLGLIMDEMDGGDMSRVRADLGIIQEELERIESIFRQMLDFYRPVSYEQVPLDLNAICQGVQVLMRKRLQEANILLHLELADHLPLTCGDRNQIKQVLINLMLNAAEAMPAQGGRITLHTTCDGEHVYLRVEDNGVGIAEKYQPHLFEPLFTTKTRGLGLGLAISREIMERHHGEIRVDSKPGLGTTFTLVLGVEEQCHEVP